MVAQYKLPIYMTQVESIGANSELDKPQLGKDRLDFTIRCLVEL